MPNFYLLLWFESFKLIDYFFDNILRISLYVNLANDKISKKSI